MPKSNNYLIYEGSAFAVAFERAQIASYLTARSSVMTILISYVIKL